jgi:hypothetical protein
MTRPAICIGRCNQAAQLLIHGKQGALATITVICRCTINEGTPDDQPGSPVART